MLYLVRHAHALAEEENALRPLSPRGHDEVAATVALFKANGVFAPVQVWHSPLVRALETARDLQSALAPEAPLVEVPGLLPEDDPDEMASRIAAFEEPLAIVGHEPHLGHLATLLVRDKRRPVIFHLRKGAVLALEPSGGHHKKSGNPRWRVAWHFSPELLAPAQAAASPSPSPTPAPVPAPTTDAASPPPSTPVPTAPPPSPPLTGTV